MTPSSLSFPRAIHRLSRTLETFRREELDRHRKKMTPVEAEISARLLESINEKLVQTLVRQLEAAGQSGETDTRLQVLQELFQLGKDA